MHKLIICTYNFKAFPPFYPNQNLTKGKEKMDVNRWKKKAINFLHLYNPLVENQTMCEHRIHFCLWIINFRFKFSIKL